MRCDTAWGIFPFLFLAIYILSWFVLRDGTFQRKDFSLFYQHLGKYPHCRLLCCISMPLSVSLFLSLSPSDNTTHTRSLDIDASFSLVSYFFVVCVWRCHDVYSSHVHLSTDTKVEKICKEIYRTFSFSVLANFISMHSIGIRDM